MSNKEIEIQVRVEHSQPLVSFLKQHAQATGTYHQVDEYYTPEHRDFLAVRPAVEWLRLRNADGTYYITYKNFHPGDDGRNHSADEYETTIGSLDQFHLIFQSLNFTLRSTVDKIRSTYRYQDYEIALDHIHGLGDFVEVEYKGENNEVDPAKITTEMIKFLKGVGVGKIYRNYGGYPFQLMFPDEVPLEEF